jgi:putative phosphoribosyl transferase
VPSGDPVVVLGLPRGGVPVAYEVAAALGAPLDVLVVRKLGVPGRPELAMGAVASGEVRVLNDDVLRLGGISADTLERITAAERERVRQAEQALRGGRDPVVVADRVAVVVDDGLATGATMRAAVTALRPLHPTLIVAAAPVGSTEACELVGEVADVVVCPWLPRFFGAVSMAYQRFTQTTDEEVRELLDRSRAE